MKHKNIRIALLLSLALVVFTACNYPGMLPIIGNSTDMVIEDLEVGPFNEIEYSGSGNIILIQGDHNALTLEATEKTLSRIQTSVVNNRLIIDQRGWLWFNWFNSDITATITFADLSHLETSGSASISADGLATDDLSLENSGSVTLDLQNIDLASLQIEVSGSADIQASGRAATQVVRISGSAKYQAEDLESQAVTIDISGAGDAIVWATGSLDADISGSGSVSYYGNPSVSQSVSGSGSMISLGVK